VGRLTSDNHSRISQGSVATLLQCSGIFSDSNSDSEEFLKIG